MLNLRGPGIQQLFNVEKGVKLKLINLTHEPWFRSARARLVPPAPPRRERPCVVGDLARCASALVRPTGALQEQRLANPTSTLFHTLHTKS
eukprot:scaffold24017_cov82-Phaeocystis_antarctica.AAC.10